MLPPSISVTQWMEAQRARPAAEPDAASMLRTINAIVDHAAPSAPGSRLHGERHWRDVARCALALRHVGVRADWRVVVLFAALHDSQRTTDEDDPRHGARAAAVARDMCARGTLQLRDVQAERLFVALEQHTDGMTSDDSTIGACWDADRLTLWRVGVTPRCAMMSSFDDGVGRGEAALELVRWADILNLSQRVLGSEDVSWSRIVAAVCGGEGNSSTWFHGTWAGFRRSIEANGLLQPTTRAPILGRIRHTDGLYLTTDREMACQYAEWRVEALRRYLQDGTDADGPGPEFADDLVDRRLLITISLPESALGIPRDPQRVDGPAGVLFPERIAPEWFVALEEW